MSGWVQGKVVAKRQWTDKLVSLRVEADIAPFTAGQFTRLALDIGGERVARPYSFVNAPHEQPLEVYFVVVPGGALSPRLAALEAGDDVWVAHRASGFFVLDEVPPAGNLWCLATGTGLGVFLSILATDEPWQRFRHVVLVHGVRHGSDLSYGERLAQFAAAHPRQFHMIPVVSREATPGALQGRIPALIEEGTLEAQCGVPLSRDTSQVMICGNPAMVKDTCAVLAQRDMQRNRRSAPGHVTTENYWRIK